MHLVTKERAASLPIGRVVELAVQRYSKKEGEHLKALYSRVKGQWFHREERVGNYSLLQLSKVDPSIRATMKKEVLV